MGGKSLGACPTWRSWRGEEGAARCEAAGPEKPEAYSLEYVEDFFGPENDADGCGLFAAVEWSMSYRLPGQDKISCPG